MNPRGELAMKKPIPVPSASALIDERIASFGDWRGPALAKLRKIIHQADPEIVEETAELSSPHPAFRLYYRLVGELQRHYGQELAIGRTLERAVAGTGWHAEISAMRELHLPACRMARLHALNLATWRRDPFARAAFSSEMLDELAAALEEIAAGAAEAPDVHHVMCQLVLMKDGGRGRRGPSTSPSSRC